MLHLVQQGSPEPRKIHWVTPLVPSCLLSPAALPPPSAQQSQEGGEHLQESRPPEGLQTHPSSPGDEGGPALLSTIKQVKTANRKGGGDWWCCVGKYLGVAFVPRHWSLLHQNGDKKPSSVLVMWQNPHTDADKH